MNNVEVYEKGKILKDSLRIINKLADSDLADMDGDFDSDDFEYEKLQKLIIEARKIKKSRWWSLT